jgi:hypothetical protein
LGKIYIFSETIAYTDGENIGFELLFSIDFQMQKILSLFPDTIPYAYGENLWLRLNDWRE